MRAPGPPDACQTQAAWHDVGSLPWAWGALRTRVRHWPCWQRVDLATYRPHATNLELAIGPVLAGPPLPLAKCKVVPGNSRFPEASPGQSLPAQSQATES